MVGYYCIPSRPALQCLMTQGPDSHLGFSESFLYVLTIGVTVVTIFGYVVSFCVGDGWME